MLSLNEVANLADAPKSMTKRSMRRPRRAGDKRGQIADLVSISKRPATVEDRAVPGHWEGDLLSGLNNSYIATLVERHTRYLTLAKVANKDTQTVVSALIKQAKTIPNELYRGPRQGACRPSTLYVGDQCGRLLLRPAKSMAAWIQREHQRSAEAVFS
jgi:IS30 family transposase